MDKRLATPTDIKAADVGNIAEALNRLLADSYALYLKYKNFHWHVAGPHFRQLHLLFDEHAAAILGSTDILAERIRRIGGTTLRSISHIAELQTITDNNEDYVTPDMMTQELMSDNRATVKALRKAHSIADEAGDVATASELEIMIDAAENRAWFLFELSQENAEEVKERGR